jgi:hypothetical protein
MTNTSDLIRDLEILHHLYGYDDEGVCHDSEAEAEAYSITAAKLNYELDQPESTLSKILKRVAGTEYFVGQERDENDFWALIIAYWYEKAAAEKQACEPLVENLASLYDSLRVRVSEYISKVQKKLTSEAGRAPPKIFLPIPNLIELGGYARSESLPAPLVN